MEQIYDAQIQDLHERLNAEVEAATKAGNGSDIGNISTSTPQSSQIPCSTDTFQPTTVPENVLQRTNSSGIGISNFDMISTMTVNPYQILSDMTSCLKRSAKGMERHVFRIAVARRAWDS
ncbi:hypothetical protein QIS74_00007 [Colletotrichum tabaci]|uniref:Uncharacterized protein n=1 Tax=Colletotrichum tabaci TaxID=1209068 RepID=A0AAV9TS33_9PEZI